ncbi:Wzz/FepE/Etk N-terminal domain-containing protein [uncultured Massilia sp.]|uniref:GumC family protein n=1 Tax=uncultured Massilia sp. TaxID=169973 RepID=UPI0025EEDBF9|nr:Wzz/FepE/Etk N-terminal domain-containing protein [uncultured Massilia sp.]
MQDLEKREAVPQQSDEIGVVDILIVLAKHKKRILGVTVAAAVLSAGVAMVLPSVYQATAKLLPPQQSQSSAAAMLSQLGSLAGAAAGAAGLKNPNDLYVGMLKSRTVADRLVTQFDLKKAYDTDSLEIARQRLESSTNITSGKDNLITIEVEDKDRKRVAPLANAYVNELLRLTKVLAVTEASQRRMFYERQLGSAKDNLAKAEMELKSTLDTRGVISVDAESRAIVETVGRLKAQVSAKEIQLSSMRAFVTDANPDYRRVQEELNGLRTELSRLENGRGGAVSGADKTGGLENVKVLREVKYQQMLYELLAKQYEVARIDEAKDPSVIQVLDPAVEPERKSKPKRALIVLLATAIAALGAIIWAFLAEAKEKAMASSQGAAQWAELKRYLRFGKSR